MILPASVMLVAKNILLISVFMTVVRRTPRSLFKPVLGTKPMKRKNHHMRTIAAIEEGGRLARANGDDGDIRSVRETFLREEQQVHVKELRNLLNSMSSSLSSSES